MDRNTRTNEYLGLSSEVRQCLSVLSDQRTVGKVICLVCVCLVRAREDIGRRVALKRFESNREYLTRLAIPMKAFEMCIGRAMI